MLAESPLFEVLARNASDRPAAAAADAPFRRTLAGLPAEERLGALEHHLREQAARVLGLAPARIALREPLGNLGFDSLMTLELRNRIEASLGLKLSATVVWNYPTITALAEYLARKLDLAPADAAARPAPAAAPSALAVAVRDLTEDEAAAALAETLGRLTNGDRHDHVR
jgi:acyl carrier protein